MEKSDFSIAAYFTTGPNLFICTDIGTRTVAGIKLAGYDPGHDGALHWVDRRYDPGALNGPPYHYAEHVFDEYDLDGCEDVPNPQAWTPDDAMMPAAARNTRSPNQQDEFDGQVCPIPCLACGKSLPTFDLPNHPVGGIEFTGRGAYGSRFDQFSEGDEMYAVNICDECLARAAENGRVSHVTVEVRRPPKTYRPWTPRS